MVTPPLLDDPELAARIRNRDSQALAAVVETYLDQVVRAARGAGLNQQQAEEAAQNTFTTFIETAPRFEGRSHVRTWIFGILYRKLQEARRGFQLRFVVHSSQEHGNLNIFQRGEVGDEIERLEYKPNVLLPQTGTTVGVQVIHGLVTK